MKILESEKVKDQPLPDVVTWESISGAPESVMDLNVTDGQKLLSIDSDGNFMEDVINPRFNTQTKLILAEFQFQDLGAIAMKTDANNGLWLSPTGILGKKAGATTFAIDTSGNATFSGSVVSASISSSTITGTTITGGTIRTASSGERVQMLGATNTLQIIDSGGTVRAESYANGWQFRNSGGSVAGRVFVDPTLAYFAVQGVNNDLLLQCANDLTFAPGGGGISAYFAGGTKNFHITSGNLVVNNMATVTDLSVSNRVHTSLIPQSNVIYALGSSTRHWNAVWTASLYLRSGQTTNPTVSGQINFYDTTGGGFRGRVGTWLGQFDMTAK